MKKRFLTVFLTLLTVIIASTFFIACSDNDETPPPSSCEHVGDGSGYCALCDEIIGTTDGVVYGLSSDETYAEVKGYEGSFNRVIIAAEYQSKPVKNICESVFNYSTLTSVVIPNSTTYIGNDAFANCNNLMKVNFLGTIDQWAQINFGNAYANPLNCAKNLYINNELINSATITSTTKIADYAFYGCGSLEEIVLSDNVESIGYAAFFLNSLTTVTIGYGVRNIDYGAFYGCSKLESISISDSVNSIGESAFRNCSSLENIVIPNNVISIGDDAFFGCSKLTIYCKVKSEPSGWSPYWNLTGSLYETARIPVVWGYNG